jgi:hypothetical protein
LKFFKRANLLLQIVTPKDITEYKQKTPLEKGVAYTAMHYDIA